MAKGISFLTLLRSFFVLFSLFLLQDAFSRWDGFSYYGTFFEFLPSFALVFILWSITAAFAAIITWIIFRVFQWVASLIKLNITFEHLFIQLVVFMALGASTWIVKKFFWRDVQTSIFVKEIVFFTIALCSIFISWTIRSRAERWIIIVQEKITPLVWIFGCVLILSHPVVAYHAWFKNAAVRPQNASAVSYADGLRPNIILVTFDALAAQEMSLYGYHRKTTPFIDEWSKTATVFNRVEAASNFTASTTASLMTGKRVWTHLTYHIEGSKPVRSATESLPFLLKENGYFNLSLVVNPFASVRILGMSDSFNIAPLASEFGSSPALFGWKFGIVDRVLYRAFGDRIKIHNWIIKNDFILSKVLNVISRNIYETSVPPEKTFNKFLDIVDTNIPTPFFAWIHLFPPHDPYLPPMSFRGTFNTLRELRAYKPQERLIEESYKYLFQYGPVPEGMEPAITVMRDYYDEYVAYIDDSFKGFIRELNKRGMNNTAIILSADHGESFDHGYLTHGGPFLYEQVTHIPLIVKETGQTKGVVIDALSEQIDIPATILDLAGIAVPSWMEGRSLVPMIRGGGLLDQPVFSMNLQENRSKGHQITTGSISVWEGDYKLIHYLGRDESLLFNLKNDPQELENLFDRETGIGQRLLNIFQEHLNRANEKIRDSL